MSASRETGAAAPARTYRGSCFCGTVQLTVTGTPAVMGYCHCQSCRSWSASPINAFTLWPQSAVKVSRGAESIAAYMKTPYSNRRWCIKCGGHVFTEHPSMGLTDVYAATIPEFPFSAGMHVNYQEAKLRVRDGLPKMKDVPVEMGGSGAPIPE